MTRPVYLDHNATTPVDPRVLEAMLPYFKDHFGNASSVDHVHGARANTAIEASREAVAKLLGSRTEEVIFTSGATESNNLALVGAALANKDRGRHIISTAIEHPAVQETLEHLAANGFEVTTLPVQPDGRLDPAAVETAVRPDTILVSVMMANNEIGTIQPIEAIGALTKPRGIILHTDAAQAATTIPIDVEGSNIDLLSLSAHKIYGPKGVGALFVRRRNPRVKIAPMLHGGGHERGLRSGTLNVPGIVGMGVASDLARTERRKDIPRVQKLRDALLRDIKDAVPGVEVNGSMEHRLASNLNVWLPGIENRAIIQLVSPIVSLSAGSACTTTEVTPSHVLLAIGRTELQSHQSIRLAPGRFTKVDEVATVGRAIKDATERLLKVPIKAP